jgi:hypothetical protein
VLPGESEVAGLLALMLLIDARRPARTGPDGALIQLTEQDRSRWNPLTTPRYGVICGPVVLLLFAGTYVVLAAISASNFSEVFPSSAHRSGKSAQPRGSAATSKVATTVAVCTGWRGYPGPALPGGEPPGTGGEPGAARWNWMRAAGMRSCSRASRASARASAGVGRFGSRARGHSRA